MEQDMFLILKRACKTTNLLPQKTSKKETVDNKEFIRYNDIKLDTFNHRVEIAYSFIEKENDEIIISEMEHHSNIVPWQMICEEKKLKQGVVGLVEDTPDFLALPALVFTHKLSA